MVLTVAKSVQWEHTLRLDSQNAWNVLLEATAMRKVLRSAVFVQRDHISITAEAHRLVNAWNVLLEATAMRKVLRSAVFVQRGRIWEEMGQPIRKSV